MPACFRMFPHVSPCFHMFPNVSPIASQCVSNVPPSPGTSEYFPMFQSQTNVFLMFPIVSVIPGALEQVSIPMFPQCSSDVSPMFYNVPPMLQVLGEDTNENPPQSGTPFRAARKVEFEFPNRNT